MRASDSQTVCYYNSIIGHLFYLKISVKFAVRGTDMGRRFTAFFQKNPVGLPQFKGLSVYRNFGGRRFTDICRFETDKTDIFYKLLYIYRSSIGRNSYNAYKKYNVYTCFLVFLL